METTIAVFIVNTKVLVPAISPARNTRIMSNIVEPKSWIVLDCPENPQMSAIVRTLMGNRDVLEFPQWSNSMASSYHRYYCLHCKEPFTDKHHVGQINHSLHMSKHSCQPSCKMVLLMDEKYKKHVDGYGSRDMAKECLICNVKIGTRFNYKTHEKDIIHTKNVLNLLRKDVIMDGHVRKTIKVVVEQ